MSRKGVFEEFQGGLVEIIVEGSVCFIETRAKSNNQPSLECDWYGTPPPPFSRTPGPKPFAALQTFVRDNIRRNLSHFDRSIAGCGRGLLGGDPRENHCGLVLSAQTGFAWTRRDTNRRLPGFQRFVVRRCGLRSRRFIEWPAESNRPCEADPLPVTMDIVRTIADVVGWPMNDVCNPQTESVCGPLFKKRKVARRINARFQIASVGHRDPDKRHEALAHHRQKEKKQLRVLRLRTSTPKEENQNQFDPKQ